MSVAVDANVLVYGSNVHAPEHDRAVEVLEELLGGSGLVYVFWPVATAYLRIVTQRRVFPKPLAPVEAVANLDALFARPNVRSPGEPDGFWTTFRSLADETPLRGKLVPDAHLVALMRHYGVRTLLTRDRDFRRFDGIRVRDPFA